MNKYPLSHAVRCQRVSWIRAPWLQAIGLEILKLENALGEIQQIASQRGLDSQNTYDFVLEDIEDRCLKALGINNET